jgi:hypothetical protein
MLLSNKLVVSDYRLDDRSSIPGREKNFSSGLCIQTSSETHPASYSTGAGGQFPEVKRGRGVPRADFKNE